MNAETVLQLQPLTLSLSTYHACAPKSTSLILFFCFPSVVYQQGGKSNEFLPYLIIMQFLTNAAYLPYLFLRSSPKAFAPIDPKQLSKVEEFGELKWPAAVVLGLGFYTFYWTLAARPEFGGIAERFSTFNDILFSDRLTFSFVTDFLYFWIFQGWLIDEDLGNRVGSNDYPKKSVTLAKRLPFFGLILYLLTRPPLNTKTDNS